MPGPTAPTPTAIYSTLALLLLLTPPANAFSCSPLRLHDSAFPWDSLQLLRDMAPSPIQPCLQQHAPCSFPDTLLDTNDTQQAAHTALHLILSSNTSSTPSAAPAPPHTGSTLHAMTSSTSSSTTSTTSSAASQTMPCASTGEGPRNLHLSINKYFSCIQHFLHNHTYSPCAWDHVHLKAHACFQSIHCLTCTMR